MDSKQDRFQIGRLVKTWQAGSLTRNEEYQRGAAWTLPQMQGLVDSIFRKYPIPPLFLHEKRDEGLGGETVKRYEIVDGQQRIRALDSYLSDKFPLLEPTDRRLRLPNRLRTFPAPWGGKRFTDLPPELGQQLETTSVDVFIITAATDDEVRDLFIRLQSGTALTRQQIRDAWPGAVGPYLERLAGKLDRKPAIQLFSVVDKRGNRSEDERDQYDADRQFCAQLLCLFLARERDPRAEQSILANDLDKLYHDNTDFPSAGPTAKRFETVLGHSTEVFKMAMLASLGNRLQNKTARFKKKFKKLDVIAVVFLIQDLTRSPLMKLDQQFYIKLAKYLCEEHELPGGKTTSGPTIATYYEEWRKKLPELGIRLDPKRLFDDVQKSEMFQRQSGKCAVCGEDLRSEDAEGDHYPLAHTLGGPTSVDNGRLVHKTGCHPRGRPAPSTQIS
jgi:hypothetical protein